MLLRKGRALSILKGVRRLPVRNIKLSSINIVRSIYIIIGNGGVVINTL